MKPAGAAAASALSLIAPGLAGAGEPSAPPSPAPLVFFDIAGPDLAAQSRFYAAVFGWTIGPSGAIGKADTGALNGTLRQDPPGKVLYLGAPDVAKALEAVVKAGGSVVQPRFVVPGVVIIGLFKDPAGNIMGLVETRDGHPIVPPGP